MVTPGPAANVSVINWPGSEAQGIHLNLDPGELVLGPWESAGDSAQFAGFLRTVARQCALLADDLEPAVASSDWDADEGVANVGLALQSFLVSDDFRLTLYAITDVLSGEPVEEWDLVDLAAKVGREDPVVRQVCDVLEEAGLLARRVKIVGTAEGRELRWRVRLTDRALGIFADGTLLAESVPDVQQRDN
jgi:hypothetical protein